MADFFTEPTYNFHDLLGKLDGYARDSSRDWIFRGQYFDWHLETHLERSIESAGLKLKDDSRIVESEMVRNFRRYYEGDDKQIVLDDTLYCLSLLQHHGAPTRLLDWTYSKYVAIYNGIECAFNNSKKDERTRSCAVWCLNTKWCNEQAKQSIKKQMIENEKVAEHEAEKNVQEFVFGRGDDKTRIDKPEVFDKYYRLENINYPDNIGHKQAPYKFVLSENPFRLHNRLYIQQAVSLCPGDVTAPFEENITALQGFEGNVIKITCVMGINDFQNALIELWRMNLSRASLFPGFDGYAQSMKYNLNLFKTYRNQRIIHCQNV
jgi:hypothetical protein